jgi:hypothetical protein
VSTVLGDETDLPDDLAPIVEHGAQNFRGHDKAAGVGVDGHISRHETHILELLLEFPVFLRSAPHSTVSAYCLPATGHMTF